MSHAPHEELAEYSPSQIFVKGCEECELVSGYMDRGIATLNPEQFSRAWTRAAEVNQGGLEDMSTTEANLLFTLWSIQVQLERRGFSIGIVPTNRSF